jgi:hypothetical protein
LLIGEFPIAPVALALLAVVVVFISFWSLTLFRAPGSLGFQASFSNLAKGSAETTSNAAPTVGSEFFVYAALNPGREELSDAAVAISGPITIAFSHCHALASGETVNGYTHGPQGRIELGDIGSHDSVEVQCRISVTHRIRHLEIVKVELVSANSDPEEKFLYLQPPDAQQGQEAAEAQTDREIRTSPALWKRASMVVRKGAFQEQGDEWARLDPHYLHGFPAVPGDRFTTLRHLEDTRVQSSKIVSLRAFITSRPVTLERFKAKGSGRQATRQVYAIGQSPGERGGWCTTTRSTSQLPLREGNHVKLRAAVVEWGRSEASGGFAVMLNCPAARALGHTGKRAKTAVSGAAAAPSRLSH